MVDSGYPFKLGGRVSQRNMERDRASRLAFRTAAQKALIFQEMLPMKLVPLAFSVSVCETLLVLSNHQKSWRLSNNWITSAPLALNEAPFQWCEH